MARIGTARRPTRPERGQRQDGGGGGGGGGGDPTPCGCALDHGDTTDSLAGEGGRKAAGVDAGIKERNLKRLRRIEGQVRGLQRMVEGDRYCADIVMQVSAVQEALRSVSRELMRNHLRYCATRAIRGTTDQANAMYDELVDLMFTHNR